MKKNTVITIAPQNSGAYQMMKIGVFPIFSWIEARKVEIKRGASYEELTLLEKEKIQILDDLHSFITKELIGRENK